MKHYSFFIYILIVLFFAGCRTTKDIPQIQSQTVTKTEYIETIKYDTITITPPAEYIERYVYPTDTLKLAISTASATAYIDTATNTLKGCIQSTKIPLQTIVPVKEKTEKKDSLIYLTRTLYIYKDKPVHYSYEKWLWLWLILTVGGGLIYIKNKWRAK